MSAKPVVTLLWSVFIAFSSLFSVCAGTGNLPVIASTELSIQAAPTGRQISNFYETQVSCTSAEACDQVCTIPTQNVLTKVKLIVQAHVFLNLRSTLLQALLRFKSFPANYDLQTLTA